MARRDVTLTDLAIYELWQADVQALRASRERLRLAAIIAKHQLPPPKRRGSNQRDLAEQLAICTEHGDLEPWEDDEADG